MQGDYMNSEEHVPTLTTNVEPMTGDKRRREDGGASEGRQVPSPGSRNGAQNGNGQNTYVPHTGTVVAQPGHDSLYIGDLQWVCTPPCVMIQCFNLLLVDNR